jgi:hypothetical protein
MKKNKIENFVCPGLKFISEEKDFYILSLKPNEYIVLESNNNEVELIGYFNEKDLKIEFEGNKELYDILNQLIKKEQFFPSTALVL